MTSVNTLTPRQREWLFQKLQRVAAQGRIEVVPRQTGATYPLSFAQERLWVLDKLAPENPAYTMTGAWRLRGPLDVPALRRALGALSRRHESLRTAFGDNDGRAVQMLRDGVEVPLEERTCPEGTKPEAWVEAQLAEEARTPFALDAAPLARVRILTLGAEERVLVVSLHHAVADGWSVGVLARELGELYRAERTGQTPRLPRLAIQPLDYALWQRRWLTGDRREQQLEYWKQRLAGVPALELPLDFPRPARRGGRGAAVRFGLSADLTRRLEALASEHQATLFMVLTAGFTTFLHRCSRQSDVAIGTPVAGRTRGELEGLIGLFVNTVVLRTRVSPRSSFRALLEAVRTTSFEAFGHQDVPFEAVVDALKPERNLSRSPLFQVQLVLQNTPPVPPALDGLEVAPLPPPRSTAKFDLTLEVTKGPSGLACVLEYDAELFQAATIERWAGHLAVLLEAAAAAPDTAVEALPLLSPAERIQELEAWNRTGSPSPQPTLPELVAAQARRTPGAVAVEHDGVSLTYAELERRAEGLARRLRALGVGPEVFVGVCLKPVPELVVALLAVAKAGGAYVPLDPSWPEERLAFVIADAKPRVLVTERATALPKAGLARLDIDAPEASAPPSGPPLSALAPDNLAYVIYTSGSTGRPKGVLVTHRGLSNYLCWARETYGRGEAVDAPLHSSVCFDLAVTSLWVPLVSGGRVTLVSGDATQIFERLSAAPAPGLLKLTPTHLRFFAASATPGKAPRLARTFVVGGEQLLREDLRFWQRHAPSALIVNEYGPTETVVGCCVYEARADEAPGSAAVPIGHPIACTRLYVLDDNLEPVGAGIPGELYIGGEGVARGYLDRPGLTAERFVPEPFGPPGARLYRTGDLVRRRADGQLEYLGRLDEQVKLRGYRVELGEIESALASLPSVGVAAAVVREDVPGEKRLVGYVSPRPGAALDTEALAAALRARLPEYMVPQVLVALPTLPLAASGKADKKALPPPPRRERAPAGEAAQGTSSVVQTLAGIWADMLGLAEVRPEDDFFALGGDSILAIQVVARARKAGLELTPQHIFEHPSLAALAALAAAGAPTSAASAPAPAGARAAPTPIQRWFFEHAAATPHHFNQAVMVAVHEPVPAERLEAALALVLQHHPALRLRFDAASGWASAPASAAGGEVVSWFDLSETPADGRAAAIEARADALQATLNLVSGPVFRAAYFDCGPGASHRLLLVAHHLVVDGVSWRILLEDLAQATEQLARGVPVTLPAPTSPFAEWSRALEAWAASSEAEVEARFWRGLDGSGSGSLLGAHASPDTWALARETRVELSADETRALVRDVPRTSGAAVQEVLLAALGRVLARETGAAKVLVDLEGHGREEALAPGLDLSRTVGWFTSLFPVVLDIPAEGSPAQALTAARAAMAAVPRKGVGYGILRFLSPDEALRNALAKGPRAEVSFNYLGAFAPGASETFQLVDEPSGATHDPRLPRTHRLEVSAAVLDGRLRVTFTSGRSVLSAHRVARMASDFTAEVRVLLEALVGKGTPAVAELAAARPPPVEESKVAPDVALNAALRQRLEAAYPDLEDVYPLAPLQQRMLVQAVVSAASAEYVEQLSATLEGPLDRARFDASWEALAARHAVLRTSFVWEDLAEPLQVVSARGSIAVEHVDWTGLGPEAQADAQERLLAADRRRGFDLGRGPLMRVHLAKLGKDRAWLVCTFHHCILDGWSFTLLLSELLAGLSNEVRPAPPPFRAYVDWARRQSRRAQEHFWRAALAGFEKPTALGIEQGRYSVTAHAPARHRVELDAAATERLRRFAQASRVTLSTAVQAAWALVLARYAQRDDVVFGIAVSGRPTELPGSEAMVGMFINMLPMRVRVRTGEPLVEWLRKVQADAAQLRKHEASSGFDIQAWSAVPPGEPLFHTSLVFENYPVDAALRSGAGALRVSGAQMTGETHHDFLVEVRPGNTLSIDFSTSRDRYSEASVQRLAQHFVQVLAQLPGAATAGEVSLAEVPGVTASRAQTPGARREDAAPLAAPAPRESVRRLPLSFAQQRLWFLDQLDPGTALYNIPALVGLKGELDLDALRRTLDEVVNRHEALRTRFETDGGAGIQVVEAPAPVHLEVLRWSGEGDAAAWEKAALDKELRQGFDLARGPLLRALLLQRTSERWLLALTMHHIVSDGWSIGVLVNEVARLYPAFRRGEPSPLKPLALQYGDFAVWQREWLSGPRLEQQVTYWKRKLSGLAHLELPTDHPRPPVQTHHGKTHVFFLPQELKLNLERLCRERGVTPFMALMAAFKALLHRHTGQTDVSVGTPIANRGREEIEGLIGFFVNTLVLRSEVRSSASFHQLVDAERDVALEAYAHQDLPFEQVVEAVQPERDLSRSPLFQALFVLQNAPLDTLALPGLELSIVPADPGLAKFDLSFEVTERPQGLECSLQYNSDLFDTETMVRWAGHFERLLEGALREPTRPIGSFELAGARERRRVLNDWNATTRPFPTHLALHQLIEAQAARTPGAVAVEHGGRRLTYAELDARANQLAHHLRALGVGPEVRVGLCLERGLDLPVAVLGILKAGGAYVGIDPAYPADRISFMLEDAQAPVLVSQERIADRLPTRAAHLVLLDADMAEIDARPATAPQSGVGPDNLAYIIYTSGSTGRPKGVAIAHTSAVALVAWAQELYSSEELERVLACTSICFDLSVYELFVPLSSGGAVLVVKNALSLAEEGAGLRPTLVNTVPSAMAELVRQRAVPDSVAVVNLAGEALPVALVNEISRHTRVRRVFDLYGPSEDTTYSTGGRREPEKPATIGRSLSNKRAYVLDASLAPAPIGVAGELYVAGIGLARGYLHRPDLTADRFIPDPFSREPGARMYRTGDLARWKNDGTLEFLGRVDHQVKIRGFRIELGELESVMAAVPGVQHTVVVARRDEGGELGLVGYAGSRGLAVTPATLREALRARVPEYMVPGQLVVLEALPLTPNGKVDRKALPAPEQAMSDRAGQPQVVAPRTPTEAAVAAIWCELLRRPAVGVHDNFFALGGHSLTATQLVSRLRAALAADLPMRSVFERPTVAGQAALIDGREAEAPVPPKPEAPKASEARTLPLSFAQQRLWFLEQLEPGTALYNVPITMRLEGHLDVPTLRRTFDEVVRRHETLRTRFVMEAHQPRQRVEPSGAVTLEVESWPGAPTLETWLKARLAEETGRPFDLATGPLMRARLFEAGPSSWVLAVTLHHIVADGWSLGVLIREVGELYAAFRAGRPSPLPELGFQYGDFSTWQREWLSGARLEAQLGYWKQALAGVTPLELPTDRPRPKALEHSGALHVFTLPRELVEGLERLARNCGATLFMALEAGFKAFLHRLCGQEDIAVGTPIANRTRAETEGLIGFFVNTLVLRSRVERGMSFEALLAQEKEVALAAYTHQDLPFERVVEAVEPERDQGRSPLFQVLFVLQNSPTSAFELPGVRVSVENVPRQLAKFDLTLATVADSDGTLHCTFEYRTGLFDAATIDRWSHWLRRYLEAAVEAPSRPLGSLPVLSSLEREALLSRFNQTRTEYPREASVPRLFEDTARAWPEAVAVRFEDAQLSYRELDARANQLAQRLRAAGVGVESRVAVGVERSLEMVVAVLGVLKAGGAYVPVDRSAPRERVKLMLDEAEVRVAVSDAAFAGVLDGLAAQVVRVDDASLGEAPAEAPPLELNPANLAYVMYTSGSTGVPKAVGVTHQAIVRLVRGVDYCRFSQRDVILQAGPLAFDASTFELWGALLNGGCLALLPPGVPTPDVLERTIERHGVTTLWLTAALFHAVVGENPGRLARVEQLLTGGDVVSPAAVAALARAAPGCRIIMGYGPTETTTFASAFQATGRGESGAAMPIGAPLSNARLYVLDSAMEPVPPGAPGELYIGGDGLARGYLNRADLTAERFVPDPFSEMGGGRLYRTGDRVRLRPDGALDFLGRVDFQVKLRGYRLELGEVEDALRRVGMHDAVVLLDDGGPAGKQLVAYAVPSQPTDAGRVRAALKERVPEYMVPAAVVLLEALPLNANGKVDRAALPPAPVEREARTGADFVAPEGPMEEALAAIWRELLGLDVAGTRDSFFELGGNSLSLVTMAGRIRERLGVDMPLRALLDEPTIAELALSIEERLITAAETAAAETGARNE